MYADLELQLENCIIEKEALEGDREELNILREELSALRQEVDLRRSIEEHELDGDSTELTRDSLWKRNQLVEATLQKLQAALDVSRQQNVNLSTQNEEMRAELDNMAKELENCKQIIEGFHSDVTYDQIIDKLTEENTALNSKVERLQATVDELRSERVVNKDLQQIYNDLEDELSEQLRILREEGRRDKQVVSLLETEKAELLIELKNAKAKSEARESQKQIEDLTAQLEHTQAMLKKENLNAKYNQQRIEDRVQRTPQELSRQVHFLSKCVLEESLENASIPRLHASFFLELMAQAFMSLHRMNTVWPLQGTLEALIPEERQVDEWKDAIFHDQLPEACDSESTMKYLHETRAPWSEDASFLFALLSYITTDFLPMLLDVAWKTTDGGEEFGELPKLYNKSVQIADACERQLQSIPDDSFGIFEESINQGLVSRLFQDVVIPLSSQKMNEKLLGTSSSILDQIYSQVIDLRVSVVSKAPSARISDLDETLEAGSLKYARELSEYKEAEALRASQVEELELKLKVYETKVDRQKAQESTILKLQHELYDMSVEKNVLKSTVSSLMARNSEMEQQFETERIKHNFMLPSQSLINLTKELNGTSQLELISHINDLQRALSKQTDAVDTLKDIHWLEVHPSVGGGFLDPRFFCKLNEAQNGMLEMIKSADVIPLDLKPSGKRKVGIISSYYCQKRKEKYASVERMFTELK